MLTPFGTTIGKIQPRRLISGVTLLAYLVAAIGFPMPASSATGANACGQRICCCGSETQCRASGCGCSHSSATTDEETTEPSAAPSCCESPPKPSCCAKSSPENPKPASTPSKGSKKTSGKSMQWVVGMSAQKCRGGATEWIHAQAALPGPLPALWIPNQPFCHYLSAYHETHFTLRLDRLDPPPRDHAV